MVDGFVYEIDPAAVRNGKYKCLYGQMPWYFYNTKVDSNEINDFAKMLLDMRSSSDVIVALDSLKELGDINGRYNVDWNFDIFNNENDFDNVEAGV